MRTERRHPPLPAPDAHPHRLRSMLAALLLSVCGTAFAAPIAVPDPREFARLPLDQQEAIRDDIHRRMMVATPAERTRFRAELRTSIESLTPTERAEIADQAARRWGRLSPAEREKILAQRQERAKLMSDAERRESLEQRRHLLDALTAEERARLQQPLPAR